MKRFIALVLSLVMALSLCVPAFAEGEVAAETGTVVEVSDPTKLTAAINSGATKIILGEGIFTADFYDTTPNRNLTITGQGAGTKLNFANLQVRLALFDSLTIENCTMGRMLGKDWGQLVFGSSSEAGGVYTVSNCIFNGESTQGIYINQDVAATINIEDCVFNGDFGREGAITIQNNDGVNITVNVTDCAFKNIPETSNDIFVHYEYDGWTLNVSYTVTFDANGGAAIAPQTVKENATATKPTDPTLEGFTFKGWALNNAEYNFNTAVTGNITLVAVWEAKAPAVVPEEITSDVISEDAVKASEITFVEGYETFNIASATDIDTIFVFGNILVTDAAETKINAAADGATVLGDYLDINIEVYVDNTHIGYITKLPAEVEVVIPANMLPEFPSYNNSYYTREYYVIRLHDGVAMRLNAEMVNDGLSFKSKLFSTYAVAYEDVYTGGWGGYYPIVGGTTTTPDADETVTSPKTFDAGIGLYIGMSIAAAAGSAVIMGKKRED